MLPFSPAPQYDLTYEMGFDGDIGCLMSVDAHGHLDHLDAEMFLADTVCQELWEAGREACPDFGLEIEHLWRTEHPLALEDAEDSPECWTYSYSDVERRGSLAVTRFHIASPWSRPALAPGAPRAERDRRTHLFTAEGVDHFPLMCIHHPDEPAASAIAESLFIDPSPHSLDGHIHYCTPCRTAFDQRLKIARAKAMAPERISAFLEVEGDELVARAYGLPLRRRDLSAVLRGADRDGAGRRALAAFAEAYHASPGDDERPIAIANPGYRLIVLSDIQHLVADYLPRVA